MGNIFDNAVNKFVKTVKRGDTISTPFLGEARVNQMYGEQNKALYGNAGHEGTDFRAEEGSNLKGLKGWKVVFAGRGESYYGNKVVLQNPTTGEQIEFAHLQSTNAKPGQIIESDNQIIGKTGSTGINMSGGKNPAHLHVNFYDANGKKTDITQVADLLQKNNVKSAQDAVQEAFTPKPVMAMDEMQPIPASSPKKKQEILDPYSQKGWEEMQRAEMDSAVKSGNYAGKSQGSYQIKYGDTLSGLARAYNSTVSDFMRANPTIQDANKIRAGAIINVPSSPIKSSYSTPSYSAPKSTPVSSRGVSVTPSKVNPYPTRVNGFTSSTPANPYPIKTTGNYTVRSGDNLSTIAKNLGTTVGELARKNNIVNPNKIFAGITLKT